MFHFKPDELILPANRLKIAEGHMRFWITRRPKPTRASRGRGNSGYLPEPLESRLLLTALTTLYSFDPTVSYAPSGSLVMNKNGDLFGTTVGAAGGALGSVFELPQGSGTITTLHSFTGGADGSFPITGLIIDGNENLYGTTENGGSNNSGTVFKLTKSNGGSYSFSTLADLSGGGLGGNYCVLAIDNRGNLFGATSQGGVANGGIVFEIAKGSGALVPVVSFTNSAGAAGLVIDKQGNLFGTFNNGDATGNGTLFEITQGSHTIIPLASLDGTNGSGVGRLLLDRRGNLYTEAFSGGPTYTALGTGEGTVVELQKGSSTVTTLASFGGIKGANPIGDLAIDNNGDLFGVAANGGAHNDGAVFEIVKGSGIATAIASFDGTNGQFYYGGLISDDAGNLFGTAIHGGANTYGTIFEVAQGIPVIDASTPTIVSGRNTKQLFTIAGSDFAPGCSVTLTNVTTGDHLSNVTVLSQTTSQITIFANFGAPTNDESWTVQVTNHPNNFSRDTSSLTVVIADPLAFGKLLG